MKLAMFSAKTYQLLVVELFVRNMLFTTGRMVNYGQNHFFPGVSLNTLILTFCFLFINSSDLLAQFDGGKGTKEDPYRIKTWEQLALVKDEPSSAFILTQNLDKNSPGYDQFQDSYSVSHFSANEVVGGLAGRFWGAMIKTSYAAGIVTANNQAGGLVGWSESKVAFIDFFWDVEKTGQNSNSGGASGINTKELKGKESLTSRIWNFSDIWGIKEPNDLEPLISYPFLKSIKYDPIGQKESKNPIPGLENAKVPSGINFPLVMVKTYGDPDYILGEEVDHLGQTIIYKAEDPTILRINGNQVMILKAGTTKVTASIASTSTDNSNFIPLEQIVTVEPTDLKVYITSDQKKIFGSADQELQFTISGLKYEDGQEILSGKLQREVGEDVGQYRINQGTLEAGLNYNIRFTPAYFEITKREVTLVAKSAQKNLWQRGSRSDLPVKWTGLTGNFRCDLRECEKRSRRESRQICNWYWGFEA